MTRMPSLDCERLIKARQRDGWVGFVKKEAIFGFRSVGELNC